MRNHKHLQLRHPRRAVAAAALVVGIVSGTAMAAWAVLPDDGQAAPPASTAPAPAPAPGRGFTTPDAAEQWADAARRSRIEVCTATPSSADALEHCIGAVVSRGEEAASTPRG